MRNTDPQDAMEPDEDSSEDESSSGPAEGEESDSFWGKVSKAWNEPSKKLDHDWAITGWALSVMPEVYKDARERLTGHHRNAI